MGESKTGWQLVSSRVASKVFFIWTFLIVMTLTACSSSPKIQDYPNRAIDRPYTLPQGISAWKVQAGTALRYGPDRGVLRNWVVYPFFWEQGLTDRLSLVWFPLPFEAKYRAYHGQSYELGIGLNFFAAMIFQVDGFNWTPYLDLDQRYRISELWRLDWDQRFQLEIRRGSTPALHWGWAHWFGPLFQVSDLFHVKGQLGFLMEHQNPQSIYLGIRPPARGPGPFFRYPFRLLFGARFSSQWDAQLEWRSYFLGYENSDYGNQTLLIEVSHLF